MEYAAGVNDTLNVHHIIFHVSWVVKYGKFCKVWSVVWGISVSLWAVEGWVVTVWLEPVPDMPPVSLINQHQCDLVVKWPLEKRVVVSLHEYKED